MPRQKSIATPAGIISQLGQLQRNLAHAVSGIDPKIIALFGDVTLRELSSAEDDAQAARAPRAKPGPKPKAGKRAPRGSKQLDAAARNAVKRYVADAPSLVSMVDVLGHMAKAGTPVDKQGLQVFLRTGPFRSHGKARGTKYSAVPES